MAIAETERAELVQALTTAIGDRPAASLMSSILSDGRDRLATKVDVKALEAKSEAGFAKISGELTKVGGKF